MGACQAECQQPTPQNRYTCNRSTYACSVSTMGEYNSYNACAADCIAVTPTPKYACNQSN